MAGALCVTTMSLRSGPWIAHLGLDRPVSRVTMQAMSSPAPVATLDRILDAACRCFAESGFAATRISDIAKAAGIGKGTVYEYVRSKEDLLLDSCLWAASRNEQAMGEHGAHRGLDPQGQPAVDPNLHPVRASYEVLRGVLQVLLLQNQEENRLFSDLQTVCQQRPDLLARTREAFGCKLRDWMDTAMALAKRGMAAGYFHHIPDHQYRWCARLIVAAVDGLIWQRNFLDEEDGENMPEFIAAAWVRLHLKHPEELERYLVGPAGSG